jgi:hypothetical protein
MAKDESTPDLFAGLDGFQSGVMWVLMTLVASVVLALAIIAVRS